MLLGGVLAVLDRGHEDAVARVEGDRCPLQGVVAVAVGEDADLHVVNDVVLAALAVDREGGDAVLDLGWEGERQVVGLEFDAVHLREVGQRWLTLQPLGDGRAGLADQELVRVLASDQERDLVPDHALGRALLPDLAVELGPFLVLDGVLQLLRRADAD